MLLMSSSHRLQIQRRAKIRSIQVFDTIVMLKMPTSGPGAWESCFQVYLTLSLVKVKDLFQMPVKCDKSNGKHYLLFHEVRLFLEPGARRHSGGPSQCQGAVGGIRLPFPSCNDLAIRIFERCDILLVLEVGGNDVPSFVVLISESTIAWIVGRKSQNAG